MLRYVVRRLTYMVVTLFAVSVISFIIIQLPPGDFVTSYVAQLAAMGELVDQSEVDALRARYGLGQPIYMQYAKWMGGVLKGDLGRSLQWNKPVATLIKDRLPWSFSISLVSFIFVWVVGLPIGVYSATNQYSPPDYLATFLGFVGLAVPNFLLALLALWIYFNSTGEVIVGLFSPEYIMAPWSFGKVADLLKHLWIPALITGTAGTAGLIRTMRANLLDEIRKPYVLTARAKGLTERRLLYKYPFRVAMIPAVSTIGWVLPGLFAGELLTSFVLGIPTLSPIFLGALLNQDMFLAGSIVLILSALTVVGTLISDLLLAVVDPRIKESV
ncbi:MAG: ABC transporter permease [Anaerolineae bacterium]|nr:ABC transporter permease [Anaerolineae bacterium]